MKIANRSIGPGFAPLVIAEIGINHEGDINKAFQMIDDAHSAGCECVKFQCHIVDDEMIPNDVVPGNATESIYTMMQRCQLTAGEEILLRDYVQSLGMIWLSTPFSRSAADRLNNMGVPAFKIGSGECNNYPLIEHIARFGKPVILSTGMNNLSSINPAVNILRKYNVPFVLLHCTSMYPTPYNQVRLGAMEQLENYFQNPVGLSDHSIGNYTSFAAVGLGACIIEKHFTSNKTWPGPDIPISIDPAELKDLIIGTRAIWEARGGNKSILADEKPCINFAYSSIVAIKNIQEGEALTLDNIWVKRPGTGEILATEFNDILGKKAKTAIEANSQLKRDQILD